jgi:hypothetical protein
MIRIKARNLGAAPARRRILAALRHGLIADKSTSAPSGINALYRNHPWLER